MLNSHGMSQTQAAVKGQGGSGERAASSSRVTELEPLRNSCVAVEPEEREAQVV